MHFKINRSSLILLIFCCLHSQASNYNCSTLKERCDACKSRLDDPQDFFYLWNLECREKIWRQFEWQLQDRCDLQYISCRANHENLDCKTIAYLKRMSRLEANKQRLKTIPTFTEATPKTAK